MRKFILIVVLLIVAIPFISMIYENLTGIAVYLEDGTRIGRLEITPYDEIGIDVGGTIKYLAICNIKFYTNLADVFDDYELTCDYFTVYDQHDAPLDNIDQIQKFKPEAGVVITWTKVRTNKAILVDPHYAVLGTVTKRTKGDNPKLIDPKTGEKKKPFLNQLFGVK